MLMYQLDLDERLLTNTSAKESDTFDYTTLDSETLAMVQKCTSIVKGLIKPRAKDVITAGETLLGVKHRLRRGCFGPWLEATFGKSSRTAQKFMRVASVFKNEYYSDLDIDPAALYHLAETTTPMEARQEAVNRAYQGEAITYAKAKAIVNHYKPFFTKLRSNNTVQSALREIPPHLPLAAAHSVSSFSAVMIDIPAETISDQKPTLPSSQAKQRLPHQQNFSITIESSHECKQRLCSNHSNELAKQIRALTSAEPANNKLPKEPLSAQLHLSKVQWHEPGLTNNGQTLTIPFCLCIDGPSYVLPALLMQIRENPDIRDLMSNEFSNLIKYVVELVAY